jgi:hypothetical protein
MGVYDDGKVKIDGNSIKISGVLIPHFSNIHMKPEDIEKIDVVKLGFLDRFRIQGTWDLRTWWCFDIKRPKYNEGFKIYLKRPLGPIKAVGFTSEDINKTKRILRENFEELFTG